MNRKLPFAVKAGLLILVTYFSSFTILANTVMQFDNGFSAIVKNNTVELSWTTPSGTDINHIEIEKSYNNKDFKISGYILGAVKEENEKEFYNFRDSEKKSEKQQTVYYRQKMVYNDGSEIYSRVLDIRPPYKNPASI
jgi:hypothetical protein